MNAKDLDIVRLAARTTLLISKLPTAKEQTAALKRHIEASDVFVGVVAEGNGEHRILVKGRKILEDMVTTAGLHIMTQGAIVVSCPEEALAMRHVLGDGTGYDPPMAP